jgi:arylsulfatase A-like enzyme
MLHCLLTLICISSLATFISSAAGKPNIIVFYTDDHGYADLGLNGVVADIKTPHLDALARSGVLAKNGYSTAPQCVPSRAGLLVGKFQGRFNLDSNGSSLDGFNRETTIATRLQKAGYITAQFGKWHLGPSPEITTHGFNHVFSQSIQRPFSANITLDGQDRPMGNLPPAEYHIDACSKAAAALIGRYHSNPFFLYIAYRAPHTPLDAPKAYKDRFTGEMPERRRAALAMLSAVDDGVGLITGTLKKHGLTEKTLIFFIGDNGAPLKIHKVDSPLQGDAGGWDGSLNDPLNGEKGMLAEGGMHVPFVVAWPGTIPSGQIYNHPVSALDVAATAAALAGIDIKPGDLDGVNLIPHLKGEAATPPHDALYWRWTAQSAIREGNWKLLRGGEREYLYDLSADLGEKRNLSAEHPDIASRLRTKLKNWSDKLTPPGFALGPMAPTWNDYFDHYLEGKTISGRKGKKSQSEDKTSVWEARNGTLTSTDGILTLIPEKNGAAFITHTGLRLKSPAIVKLAVKSDTAGPGAIAWRIQGEKDFLPEKRVSFEIAKANEWQTCEVPLPASGTIIHLRIHLPGGTSQIRKITMNP